MTYSRGAYSTVIESPSDHHTDTGRARTSSYVCFTVLEHDPRTKRFGKLHAPPSTHSFESDVDLPSCKARLRVSLKRISTLPSVCAFRDRNDIKSSRVSHEALGQIRLQSPSQPVHVLVASTELVEVGFQRECECDSVISVRFRQWSAIRRWRCVDGMKNAPRKLMPRHIDNGLPEVVSEAVALFPQHVPSARQRCEAEDKQVSQAG
jgi:hypothetical protein